MSEVVYWKGNPFWRQYDLESLQVLARKKIFASQISEEINHALRGHIVPIPDLSIDELFAINDPSTDYPSPGDYDNVNCSLASKPSAELSALASCPPPKPLRKSLLDERIAELDASLAAEGASRLSASSKILADLRPVLPPRSSPLGGKAGIMRLPGEITRSIISFVESRGDLSALSRVSKTWRDETLPALYSILVLRGWD